MPAGRRKKSLTSTGRLVLLLLLLSLTLFVLPRSWTRRIAGITQLLAPFQDAATRAADSALSFADGRGDDPARETAAWRSLATTLSARNEALRRHNADLTRVRERVMGSRGRLIPARIIADDPNPARRSKRITAGERDGAVTGQAVASLWFSIDLGGDDGALRGMGVLAAESLVAIVEDVHAVTSQVRLLCDPATRMAVTVGRLDGESFVSSGADFWLEGSGAGMELHDVHHQYVDNGDVRPGDVVLTVEDDAVIPPLLRIGTIAGMERDPHNGLLYVVQVEPGFDVDRLRSVYVVDWNP